MLELDSLGLLSETPAALSVHLWLLSCCTKFTWSGATAARRYSVYCAERLPNDAKLYGQDCVALQQHRAMQLQTYQDFLP